MRKYTFETDHLYKHRDCRWFPGWVLEHQLWIIVGPILVVAFHRKVEVKTVEDVSQIGFKTSTTLLIIVGIVRSTQDVRHPSLHANETPTKSMNNQYVHSFLR